MRNALPLLSCLCAGLLVATLPAQRRGSRRDLSPESMENFTFDVRSFESRSLEREVPYGIYLPESYDDEANSDLQYPLVIWLHGMFEDHRRFHQRGGAQVLDAVAGTGGFPETVFVLANGGRSFYVNGLENGAYEDLITKDLLGHLQERYRISDDRRQRAIMGISMGGMGALKIAFKHPELFGTVAAHSSAVFPEDPNDVAERMQGWGRRLGIDRIFGDPIDTDLWRAENPLCIARSLDPESLDGLRIYFDAGTEDRYGFGMSNRLLHLALQEQDIDHVWTLVQGGGHAWGSGFQKESLRTSLEFVGQAFLAAEGARKGLQGLMPGPGDDKGKKGKSGSGRGR